MFPSIFCCIMLLLNQLIYMLTDVLEFLLLRSYCYLGPFFPGPQLYHSSLNDAELSGGIS